MIIYDLKCRKGHRFECWFASSAEFDRQSARRLVRCPQCDDDQVERVPSAVHIGHGAPKEAPAQAATPSPADVMALYHQLVTEVVAASEDTGEDFANEARRIHYHEAPARAIHGKSSDREFSALREEGIEVWRLPALPKDKH